MESMKVGNLDWQTTISENKYTYREALEYARSVGDGWRIPTVDELKEIVKKRYNPSIDPDIFPNTPAAIFWTTTPYDRLPNYMVTISFYGGHVLSHEVSSQNRVRLVRK